MQLDLCKRGLKLHKDLLQSDYKVTSSSIGYNSLEVQGMVLMLSHMLVLIFMNMENHAVITEKMMLFWFINFS